MEHGNGKPQAGQREEVQSERKAERHPPLQGRKGAIREMKSFQDAKSKRKSEENFRGPSALLRRAVMGWRVGHSRCSQLFLNDHLNSFYRFYFEENANNKVEVWIVFRKLPSMDKKLQKA